MENVCEIFLQNISYIVIVKYSYNVKEYSYSKMSIPMMMLMPSFSNGRFPEFCQRHKEKEFVVKLRNCIIFHTFWCISDLLTWFSFTIKKTLLGILVFKVDNKNTRTRYETCLKLKLQNQFTRTTLSNGVLLSLLLNLNVFLTWF